MSTFKTFAKLAAWALCASTLAACVTPIVYGPISEGHGFGYNDRQNPDGGYTVLAVAPGDAMAREFWDRRAQEICGGREVHKNIFRAEVPVIQATGYATNIYGGGASYTTWAHGAFFLEGYLHCAGADAAGAAAAAADAGAAPPSSPPPSATQATATPATTTP